MKRIVVLLLLLAVAAGPVWAEELKVGMKASDW